MISITVGSSTRLYVKYTWVSSPICQDVISLIWVLLVSTKFPPPMFLQNTVYYLWILCPTVGKHTGWIIDSIPIFFAPNHRRHPMKPQHSFMTTCNITLSTAGGKIWKPKQCKLQPWTSNVLNCVVFLSLSVHKHSWHNCSHLYIQTHPVLNDIFMPCLAQWVLQNLFYISELFPRFYTFLNHMQF